MARFSILSQERFHQVQANNEPGVYLDYLFIEVRSQHSGHTGSMAIRAAGWI
ncbi:hypothetical protein [Klebsiella sp. BIGb0407]|uniref:hypothetical protein n=1 Tax=Klebsiella sp. BIGb0407 TaxID=2940603 RepID=UPI00216A2C0E|nr:hypothetical protein [Klebsiella sp. BIGb0407]MCS3430745.1 hypothetical protein [Klebsiella sp. BIGb0407]